MGYDPQPLAPQVRQVSIGDAGLDAGRDSRRAVAAARRRLPLILGCAVLAATAAFAFSATQTEQYSAQASLLFRDPGFDRLFGTTVFETQDPDREAATNVGLASLEVISDLTAKDLAADFDGDDISDKVEVESDGRSDLALITATDPNPERAALIANTFGENYIQFRQRADRQKVREAIELVEEDFNQLTPEEQAGDSGQTLLRELGNLQTLEALQTGNAELVQRAEPPTSPSSPKTLRNTILGGFLGLLLGIGLAALLERFDRRLRDPREFEEAFSLPVLATIPKLRAAQTNGSIEPLFASDAEAFQMLRTRLRYFNVDRDVKVILVTSASPGDGKTSVAWGLAGSATSAGIKSVVVEADFHRPTLAEAAGAAPLPGLAELLSGQSSLSGAIQEVPIANTGRAETDDRRIALIVAGDRPPNASELLESEEMRRLIGDLRERYDLIVIDTPPIARLADAIPLIRLVDGLLVVGRFDGTMRDEAFDLREQLNALDAPTLGVVANYAPRRVAYYYGYGTERKRSWLGGR